MGGSSSSEYSVTPDHMTEPSDVIKCSVEDLNDGEMKEIEASDGKKILLVKEKGKVHALSSKCTHYGAPLVKGSLCNGRIQCPWHGACFNVATGDIEDYPGLDSLQTYHVTVNNNEATIRWISSEAQDKRVKPTYQHTAEDTRTFLIIGGGAAGGVCAETLRQNGYKGYITMATNEKHLPYDRPKLSKALNSSAESLALRKKDDYTAYEVSFYPEKQAVTLDVMRKAVTFKDGSQISYDKLLLCTGGSPQTLQIPGSELHNIFVLRSTDDGNKIASLSKGKNVVIIGQSFIGLEVAAYLVDKAASITVVGRADIPLKQLLGDTIGSVVKKMLVNRGVKFISGNSPKEFIGADGQLTHVVLGDGTKLDADVCVLGIGVHPTTDFLKDSGIKMSSDGYVLVDKRMQTNIADVYAAGDIVQFPLYLNGDQHTNIQHWQMACKHGQTAALNMLEKQVEVKSVPFFWTVILGKSLRYTGYGHGYDDIVIHGDVDSHKFAVFYTKGDNVIAVASMNFDPIVAQAAQMFHNDKTISKREIQLDPQSWTGRLKE